MTHDVLIALAAALAVAVELLEAVAIVFAVGVSRRWRDALLGAAAATVACALVAAALATGLLSGLPEDELRLIIGVLLMLFGLEWLRKGTLRLAGLKERGSARADYDETIEALEEDHVPEGEPDWPARLIAFKGVLLEGIEIVLIVGVIAAGGDTAPALIGAAIAAVVTIALGSLAIRRFGDLPETEVKWAVGVLLTAFGVFFAGEGLGVDWPGGDAALLLIGAVLAIASRAQIAILRREAATT